MLDHMSSTGVMHGDGRRHGEGLVNIKKKKENIAAVHARYRNRYVSGHEWGNIMMSRADRSSILPYIVMRVVEKGTWDHIPWNVIWWLLFSVCHLVLLVCEWGVNC